MPPPCVCRVCIFSLSWQGFLLQSTYTDMQIVELVWIGELSIVYMYVCPLQWTVISSRVSQPTTCDPAQDTWLEIPTSFTSPFLTYFPFFLCFQVLKKIAKYIQEQNDKIYAPRGLLLTDPIERGLRVVSFLPFCLSCNMAQSVSVSQFSASDTHYVFRQAYISEYFNDYSFCNATP